MIKFLKKCWPLKKKRLPTTLYGGSCKIRTLANATDIEVRAIKEGDVYTLELEFSERTDSLQRTVIKIVGITYCSDLSDLTYKINQARAYIHNDKYNPKGY